MNAGHILQSRYNMHGQQRPFFSVVIPTYERHSNLDTLIKCLKDQIERDFEVVIVDQSSSKWHGSNREYGFPFQYIHSPVKGAVRARNTGAAIAQGKIIAFVDDDCLPRRNWLINAKKYFSDTTVVGVEGKILSDHIGEPDWRPVTNSGFEGIGFMTANLFVMNSVFTQSGGFDLRFDSPHFREDTDFGWRLQEYGLIPFAEDVEVFHPAMQRSNKRESHEERGRFFQKDALLYEKHPDKYRQLFLKERHFQGTPGFKENLIAGFRNRGIPVPEWISEHLNIYSSVTSE